MRHYFSHDLRGDDLSKGQSPGAARRCVWLASCRFPSREPRARRRHRRHHSRGDQPPKTFCAIENDCNRMRNFRPRSQSQCMRSKSWNVKSSPTRTDGRSCSAVKHPCAYQSAHPPARCMQSCTLPPSLTHSPTPAAQQLSIRSSVTPSGSRPLVLVTSRNSAPRRRQDPVAKGSCNGAGCVLRARAAAAAARVPPDAAAPCMHPDGGSGSHRRQAAHCACTGQAGDARPAHLHPMCAHARPSRARRRSLSGARSCPYSARTRRSISHRSTVNRCRPGWPSRSICL